MYGFIYITTNHVNGKKYIGQKNYDTYGHWKNYLGSGIVLKSAIKKYGASSFSKEIIEECKTVEELNEREKYWIEYYNAVKSDEFYNLALGGDGGNTITGYTDEQKETLSNKLSAMRKGVVNLGKNNGSARKVICLNTMKCFDTIVEASEFYNIDKDAIQQACSPKSNRKTAGIINGERGVWEYYEENKIYEYAPFVRKFDYVREVYCINTKEVFKNASVAGRAYNIKSSSISMCCNGKLLSAGKHQETREPLVWCYVKDIDCADEKIKNTFNRHRQCDSIRNNSHSKKVKCINTGVVYDSVSSAMLWCDGNIGNFSRASKEGRIETNEDVKMFYYKKHPITKERLIWAFI